MRPGTSATVALNVARFVRFVFALRDTCVLTQVVPPFKQTITTQSLAPFRSQETTRSERNSAPRPTYGPRSTRLEFDAVFAVGVNIIIFEYPKKFIFNKHVRLGSDVGAWKL